MDETRSDIYDNVRVSLSTQGSMALPPRGATMPFADPTAYSKGQINRAGNETRGDTTSEEALEIINNWRASHAYILNTFQATLRTRTRKKPIVVAQRLKRLRTIISKLSRQSKMELARMDDVAGCRVIFRDIKALSDFRGSIHRARFGHKMRNAINKYDYIANPKTDGYRGIHDIYEYNVGSAGGAPYNGLLLELQYRTVYQHAWATSVEIVGMITENQPKFNAGDERHKEFFRLASEIISRVYESSKSCYPDITDRQLVSRFRAIDTEIRLLRTLKGLNTSALAVGSRKNVILSFSLEGKLDLFSFTKGTEALKKYFLLEKLQAGADVVLVKGDAGEAIRIAYKNYFSDTNDFVKYVEDGCAKLAPSKRLFAAKKAKKAKK